MGVGILSIHKLKKIILHKVFVVTAEKYDIIFEMAHGLCACLQDALSAYRELQ